MYCAIWNCDEFPTILVGNYLFQIAREVLDVAARMIRPGVTTEEIDEAVHQATIAAGNY